MRDDERQYLDPMTARGPYRRRADTQQPNIIVIGTDMVPVDFHTGPAAEAVMTPNIDELCRLRFGCAFATSPLCSPSRAAYMTGRHSYVTTNSERAHDGHAIHLRPDDTIFPEYLKASGYHVRHVGKCHAGAAKFIEVFGENAAPWDRWSPPWRDDDAYAAYLKHRGLDRFDFDREILGRDLTGQGSGNSFGGWIAPQNGDPFPADATYPASLAERAIDAIDARDTSRPLYLQLDFFGPHQPFAIPGGMEEREAQIRSTMSLPASYAASFDPAEDGTEPRVYEIYRRNWGLQDEATVIDYRVANQLQFELIDEMIGRVLKHLQQLGLYEETWIFFMGDHGEMNGEAGLVDKGAYLHPRVVQAPLGLKPGLGAGPNVA
ncbi:MAG: sulfatase-like hydrolase/transferase, partial [Gemmatimonadetes bacterium]|nr:sulfatase-like hydrolase/transferase [Gemmatimonadota bacterium]